MRKGESPRTPTDRFTKRGPEFEPSPLDVKPKEEAKDEKEEDEDEEAEEEASSIICLGVCNVVQEALHISYK